MGWKDWSYARKGALIGLGISLVGIILGFLLWIPFENDFLFLSGFSVPLVLSLWITCGPEGPCANGFFGILLSILFSIIVLLIYFIVGAIIGWIVGKIKSRKQSIQ